MLQAECAAVAQNCSDVAEKSLQILHHKHQQDEHGSCIPPETTSRAAVAAQGRRHRQQLAAQARAATDASTPSWQPQLCGLLQQSSEQACAHSTPADSQAGTCEVAVGDAVRDSLRFSAARAEANERFIQDLAVAVEEVLEKHTRADSEAADSAVEGIGRFLEFADTAHSRPNESSIKQLVWNLLLGECKCSQLCCGHHAPVVLFVWAAVSRSDGRVTDACWCAGGRL